MQEAIIEYAREEGHGVVIPQQILSAGHLYVVLWSGEKYMLLQGGPSARCVGRCTLIACSGACTLVSRHYLQYPKLDPQVGVIFGDGSPEDLTEAANALISEQRIYDNRTSFPPYLPYLRTSNSYVAALLEAYGCSIDAIQQFVLTLESRSSRIALDWEAGSELADLFRASGVPPRDAPECEFKSRR
jgi:hypothetical protein